MKALVFDSGAGNLCSVTRAFARLGISAITSSNPEDTLRCDLLVLPGVGAFGHAARALQPVRTRLRQRLLQGQPCVAICLGMQLLFDDSDENVEGEAKGLGALSGRVVRLAEGRVPRIGWARISNGSAMYFAHSYACQPNDAKVVTSFCDNVVASISFANVRAAQFHPEKSGNNGLGWLAEAVRP